MRITKTITAAALGVLLLAGCSSGPGANTGGEGGESSGPVTITVGTLTATGSSAMDNAAAEFSKANPDITVELVKIPGDQYQQQMRTRVGAGTAPDVIAVFPGNGSAMSMMQLQQGNFLTDLSGREWVADRVEAVKQASDVDGKTYITPSWLTLIGSIYNTEAMAEVGAEVPTTFPEVLALCDLAKSKGKAAYALGTNKPWVGQLIPYAFAATTAYGADPELDAKLAAGETTFGESGWTAALDKLSEMQARGCFNEGVLGTDYVTQMGMLAKGEALGAVQVSSADAAAKNVNAEVSLKMAAFPATDNADETRIPVGSGYGYALNAKSPHQEAGLKFLDFLASKETNAKLAEENGSLPADPTTGGATPYNEALLPYVTEGRTATFMDQNWPGPKVQAALQTGVQELLGDKKSTADVLADMQREYDAAA
ncbi:ABC transporter substrate-binding protein [Propionibacteriaceae bacterium Y2011]|uniref:ABC transporter substrate-binding protein n=1 Tax=Microlunatus sp. Y2014 TaxID=3418488 RepID=UPI003B45929E